MAGQTRLEFAIGQSNFVLANLTVWGLVSTASHFIAKQSSGCVMDDSVVIQILDRPPVSISPVRSSFGIPPSLVLFWRRTFHRTPEQTSKLIYSWVRANVITFFVSTLIQSRLKKLVRRTGAIINYGRARFLALYPPPLRPLSIWSRRQAYAIDRIKLITNFRFSY